MNMDACRNFINRELAWLDFNFRVLAEAESSSVPLLERLKFLAIVSSNLDEFFMVRVALAHRHLRDRPAPPGPDGLSPAQVLAGISRKAQAMVQRQYATLTQEILPSLAQAGIHLVRAEEMTDADTSLMQQYFTEHVLPILTPLAIDTGHPFPLLASGAVYVLLKVKAKKSTAGSLMNKARTVLIQVPGGISRFISLPADAPAMRIALLDDLVLKFAGEVVRGYNITDSCLFRVTRDADINVDEDQTDDLLAAMEAELLSRRWGAPIRLEIGEAADATITTYLRKQLSLKAEDIYRIPSIINLKSLFALPEMIDRHELADPVWPPQPHPFISDGCGIFDLVRERDIILHHPYHSFSPVVDFISSAADDPNVLAIKITLYRVSGDSPLVAALIRAAENGKQVTAMVELRARFDEQANITWAKRLDAAGAHVIYGVVGYKTHSKVALIVRRDPDGIHRYVHLATGNYNDRTARVYTDLGLMTARPEFGADISSFFNVITGYSLPPKWNHITMAPIGLREKFLSLIEREMEKHTPETPGFIRAKMNSLIDPEIIKALYRASRKGVRIDLVVRGMCSLRAGVKGLSEKITIRSILDRFLEHSRIYHFHNGGQEEVYLSSADWMDRNFDKRLELLFPILATDCRKQVLAVLEAAFMDNVKAWQMEPDGSYVRVKTRKKAKPYRSQQKLYEAAGTAINLENRKRKAMFEAIEKKGG